MNIKTVRKKVEELALRSRDGAVGELRTGGDQPAERG